jgi:hypothetical protein
MYLSYLVAESVHQTIEIADNIKPSNPLILIAIARVARKITGRRQYPRTEQVLQTSNPVG